MTQQYIRRLKMRVSLRILPADITDNNTIQRVESNFHTKTYRISKGLNLLQFENVLKQKENMGSHQE